MVGRTDLYRLIPPYLLEKHLTQVWCHLKLVIKTGKLWCFTAAEGRETKPLRKSKLSEKIKTNTVKYQRLTELPTWKKGNSNVSFRFLLPLLERKWNNGHLHVASAALLFHFPSFCCSIKQSFQNDLCVRFIFPVFLMEQFYLKGKIYFLTYQWHHSPHWINYLCTE